MDAIILNLVGDIPVVTRVWTLGCLALSVLTKAQIMDPTKCIYSFDLVFRKKQYQRLLLSLFDHGELGLTYILNLYVSVHHLSLLETSFTTKRQYLWSAFLVLVCVLLMSFLEQPVYSLGVIMHENLVYYELRKHGDEMNIQLLGGINLSPLIVPLYMNAMMYFAYNRSWIQVAMNFAGGHLLFYLDDIMSKIYDVEFTKTPYDVWLSYKNETTNDNGNVGDGHHRE